MDNSAIDTSEITAVLSSYFEGVFKGDTVLLGSVFHPQALVAGDINGEPYFKTLSQYLEGVRNRKSPFELNETFRMKILKIEIVNSIAIAKVRVPIFDLSYCDLLSLTKIGGKWVIVNKLLTNISF